MLQGIYFRPEGAKRIWPGAQRVFERNPRMGIQRLQAPKGETPERMDVTS